MKYQLHELPVITGEPVEWDGKKKARSDKKNKNPHRERMGSAPFIAWDGEGYSDDTGEHHYMLFGNSLGESVKGTSLDYRECFPLLLEQRYGINVIYGGDYDIIMMCRHMPLSVRERLHKGLPVKHDGYRMQWFRRKKFFIKHLKSGESVLLYDVLAFFATSFVKACAQYLGEDETLRDIHAMKLKRDSFTLEDGAVDSYWRSELDYLVKLMNELRRLLQEVGIKPKGWHGPGAVANAVMQNHDMKRYLKPMPDHIVDIGEKAYFGGRFEHFKTGRIKKVYEYDIRSAYPKAISILPDFYSATWEHVEEPSRIHDAGLYCVSWDIPMRNSTPFTIGPLPWRHSETGNVFYPLTGYRSWYWGIEIKHCLCAFHPSQRTIHEGWEPTFPDRTQPFAWIADMYSDRATMKREGNPAEKALKLAMNSVYGKLAQNKGAKKHKKTGEWIKPKWHNILAAGYVTAYTRAKLYDAFKRQMHRMVALETDAIFTMVPLELPLSEELGDWEETVFDDILYVHSGVYYAQGDALKTKTRGVEAGRSKTREEWLSIFTELPHNPQKVSMQLRRFGTDLRLPSRYARWYDFEINIELPQKRGKRIHQEAICVPCVAGNISGNISFADHWHPLIVPPGSVLGSDWQSSAPYKLPWRNDVHYDWPSHIRAEVIESEREMTWTNI